MADAFAASNEGLQPGDATPDGGDSPDLAAAAQEPPTSLFRHTETPVGADLTVAAEAPPAAEPPADEPSPAMTVEAAVASAAPAVSAPVAEASEPGPAAQPVPAPVSEAPASSPAPPAEPSVARTIEVPALEPGAGGEWELLVAKVRQWLASGQLQELVTAARTPLTLLAYLVVAVLVLQVYGALLGVLDSLPLVPGLLELVGVITVARFTLTRLVRSSDRQQVIAGLRSRWNAFRGQG